MLSKAEIVLKVNYAKGELSSYGVSKIGIFGSAVRGQMREDSDIDILIDFENDKENFLNFIASCEILENAFAGYRVDVVTFKGLSPFIGKHIEKEVEYV
ncbi:Nucleotidyltransferase family protein [Mucinivorans hirudinis]|uniref:Nucleotidyltransferase family protein n=1 Tax=Mucinivorans hirudinis TaxID=1433126 RepID=A0A060R887_9BACT|nr:Nucleotidyltransferase family protein [Mucinivorans hirudinis]